MSLHSQLEVGIMGNYRINTVNLHHHFHKGFVKLLKHHLHHKAWLLGL